MRMNRVLLFLGCFTGGLPAIGFGQTAVENKTPTITGVVRDEGDTPIADAQLSLSRQGQPARLFRTGADGKYSFANIAPGEVQISVRRLGYRGSSKSVEVTAGSGETSLDFQLTELPSDVADVIVEASKGHLQEFYEHKANSTFAKFFEQKDIEKRHPTYLSELLRTVAGASLYASERTGNHVMLRDCKPMVWLDGMRAPGAELDEVARPMDVAGMEVYPSSAGLPPQYQDRNNRMCGAIIVWTRNQ
jgi:Carboxypeptidase regulatory-like domain